MTVPAHETRYRYADYLALEAASNVKHEFLDGQIYGMAGGTPEHAALAAAFVGLLFGQLRGGSCRVFDSDLRVRVLATGLATYPDVAVVCGPLDRDPEDPNAVTNPTLLVEVLSPGTERYDRGDKLAHYQKIPALRQIVLVEQDSHRVELWTRTALGDWEETAGGEGDVLDLASIGAQVDVDELYDSAVSPAD